MAWCRAGNYSSPVHHLLISWLRQGKDRALQIPASWSSSWSKFKLQRSKALECSPGEIKLAQPGSTLWKTLEPNQSTLQNLNHWASCWQGAPACYKQVLKFISDQITQATESWRNGLCQPAEFLRSKHTPDLCPATQTGLWLFWTWKNCKTRASTLWAVLDSSSCPDLASPCILLIQFFITLPTVWHPFLWPLHPDRSVP